jgi:hypothetical protein
VTAEILSIDQAKLQRYGQWTTITFNHAPVSDLASMSIQSTHPVDPEDLIDWLYSAAAQLQEEVIQDDPETGVGPEDRGGEP